MTSLCYCPSPAEEECDMENNIHKGCGGTLPEKVKFGKKKREKKSRRKKDE